MASDAVAGIPPDEALAFEDVREVRASGINAHTGEYLTPALDAAVLGAIAEGRELTDAERLEIKRRQQAGAVTCVFHAKLDTDSTASWTVIPRQAGHRFQGKLDT